MAIIDYDNIQEIGAFNDGLGNAIDSNQVPGVNNPQISQSGVMGLSAFVTDVNSGLIGGLRGWNTSVVFSSGSYNAVAWTSGTINLSNGNSYSINSGSLTLTGTHYIYLDTAVSTTVLQNTTVPEDSVGGTKLLVAFTKINSDTTLKAIIKTFGGQGDSFVVEGLNIAASAVTAAKTSIAAINSTTGEINANKVGTTQIDTDAVTSAKILNGAITANKTNIAALNSSTGDLNSNTVDTAQIVNNAITNLKLLDGAVTAAKTNIAAIAPLTGNLNSNTVDTAQIVNNAVTSLKVLDGAITAAKTNIAAIAPLTGNLNSGTVDTAQLVNNAVTSLKILDGAIETAKIATGAVTESTIATNAITSTKISDDAITTPKIYAGAITTAKIAANAVTANEIAAGSITTAKIYAGAVTSNELAANSVVAGKIAAGTIVSADIAADTITAANIAANAITSNELASNSVVAGKIAAGTIVAADIAANTITASQIASATITSNEIASNTIVAGNIAAGTITATQIAAGTITATEIAAGTITANKLSTYNFVVSAGTFSDNSPGAGSVSWSSAKVVYNGTEYSVTNGNTSNKYVYWQLASPTVFATSATLPALGNDDFLVFTNTSGTHTLVWNSTVINGNRITAGSVTATNIAAGTITTNEIASATIVAGNIAAGTITGSNIAAGTITAANISASTITATEIAANTITANKLNINSLSAISADLGTITAGTITGATIQTASSGLRMVMTGSDNSLNFYDSSNNNVMTLGYASTQRTQLYIKSPNDGNNTYVTAYISSARTNNTLVVNAETGSSTPVLGVIAQDAITSPSTYYSRPIAKFLNSSSSYVTLEVQNLSSAYAGYFKSVGGTSLYVENGDGVGVSVANAAGTHPAIAGVNTYGIGGYFECQGTQAAVYIKNSGTGRGITLETGDGTGIYFTGSDANAMIATTTSPLGPILNLTNNSSSGGSTSSANGILINTYNTCITAGFINNGGGRAGYFSNGSTTNDTVYISNASSGPSLTVANGTTSLSGKLKIPVGTNLY